MISSFQEGWESLQDELERSLFLLATFSPEWQPVPLWLLGLAAGLEESEETPALLEQACQHIQVVELFEAVTDTQVSLSPPQRQFGRHLVEVAGVEGKLLVARAAQRLLLACWTLDTLKQRALRVGYQACKEQVQSIRHYLDWLGVKEYSQMIERLEDWLSLESSLFTDTTDKVIRWPGVLPDLFCQQLYNRSVEANCLLIMPKEPTRWLRLIRRVGTDSFRLLSIPTPVALSPDGKLALSSGSYNEPVSIWDVESGRELRQLRTLGPLSVAFSPDARLALTGNGSGADYLVRIWDVESGRELRQLQGHMSQIESIAISPDGRLVLTGSRDWTARLWDMESGRQIRRFGHSSYCVARVAFSSDGRSVITSLKDEGAIRRWEVERRDEGLWEKDLPSEINRLIFSPDGRIALTCGSSYVDNTIRIWDVESGQMLRLLQNWTESSSASFMPWKILLRLSRSTDLSSKSWLDDFKFSLDFRLRERMYPDGRISSIAISPDGRLILTGSVRIARLWEVSSGRLLQRLEGHTEEIRSVVFSPSGRLALTCGYWNDKTAYLWEVSSGRRLRSLRHEKGVTCIAFSPDEKFILTGSRAMAYLWEVSSGRRLRSLLHHSVTCIAFSPDGRLSITSSRDRRRLWEMSSGQRLWQLPGLSDRPGYYIDETAMTFSPDGKLILISSSRNVRVWEVESRRELMNLFHEAYLGIVEFSPDGRLLIVCTRSGRIYFYSMQGPERGKLLGIFVAPYEVGALYWQQVNQLVVADKGGPMWRPHFSQVMLEGKWEDVDDTRLQIIRQENELH